MFDNEEYEQTFVIKSKKNQGFPAALRGAGRAGGVTRCRKSCN